MDATEWEFRNRAMIFGLIIGLGFFLYIIDQHQLVSTVALWLGPRLHLDKDLAARLTLAIATAIMATAALIRTWASAHLHAKVVYAPTVRADSLVADGPYRRVRNPLYLANILMVLALGFVMNPIGFVVAVVATVIFCYRLILREETALGTMHGTSYAAFRAAVPRLMPSPWPRIPSAGSHASWADGFRAESWYWGFALSLGVLAATAKIVLFWIIIGASLVLFWIGRTRARKAD